ncbi:fumarylacetoacetate hydrolase family protein [Pseudonocardia acidicola]|uniref:Fumarylacetoacetate hydrolase family protein n=1 Tax=Pseudonocardia acidicola TaxID=2724939 RepID=A0ABX1S7E9_9PSEU|nr:fumarylacetoacetate hydrolase family protein [Pseudonocardia acidicola]NMH97490.1 fumarylacetoacetate hydrolase family protein [Pseudonocardia acidicola]
MRWVTYLSPADGQQHIGLVRGGAVAGLRGRDRLLDLFGDDGERLAEAARSIESDPLEVIPEADATLCAPVPVPPSIRDFMAFEEHVVTSMAALGRTVDPVWYEIPVFYFTNPAAVRGPCDDVEISPGSTQFDYELEAAAIIGRPGANIRVEDAESHIAGYTILCDWSARDLQDHEMRQGLGPAKGKDGATSLGPYLVTPDELADHRGGNAFDLPMTATVNGRRYSAGNLADLHWSFAQMISYASRGTTLRPGDVIGSGTVGTGCILELSRVHGEQAYPWLSPGDEVVLEIERLGAVRSRILHAPEVVPLR